MQEDNAKYSIRWQLIILPLTITCVAILTILLFSINTLTTCMEMVSNNFANSSTMAKHTLKSLQTDIETLNASGATKEEVIASIQETCESLGTDEKVIYALFISSDLVAVAHSHTERIGISLKDDGSIAAAKDGEPFIGTYIFEATGENVIDVLEPFYVNGELIGALNVGISMSDTFASLNNSKLKIIIIAVTSFFLIALLLFVLINNAIKMIKTFCKQFHIIASGDLTNDVPENVKKRKDEFGVMARAVSKMQTSVKSVLSETIISANEVLNASQQLAEASQISSNTTANIACAMDGIAQGAENQARNTATGASISNRFGDLIETQHTNLDNMTDYVSKINILKDEGLEVLNELITKTEHNNTAVQVIKEIINTTNESAIKIESASKMIEDITAQTNLLALNAAIEAARAGEAGKGFAVVSEEIGKLADQSKASTVEINSVIKELIGKSNHAVETTEEVSKTVTSQGESVNLTNEKFEGISSVIEEIKHVMNNLNESSEIMSTHKSELTEIMDELSAVAEENAASVEEVSASIGEQSGSIAQSTTNSESLYKLAEHLKEIISTFKL